MRFCGIEVKPGKPYPYHADNVQGKLHVTQGFRSSPSSANLAAPALHIIRKVEAKYPALLFKQQLTAYVEKIYGII
ncbi:hypothetical protein K1719_027556 [Acacia pycnantha]|nr:hypothetical protein K1719_027556 [Acacia pycnantha]